jgi:hypothetical protein
VRGALAGLHVRKGQRPKQRLQAASRLVAQQQLRLQQRRPLTLRGRGCAEEQLALGRSQRIILWRKAEAQN